MLTEEQIAAIRARAEAATPGNLDTVNDPNDEYGGRSEGVYECPMCNGDGSVDGVTYCNFDDVAMGVQFFGIGEEHGKYEQFFRAANPAAVLALLSALDAAIERAEKAEARRKCYECGSEMTACAQCNPELVSAELATLRARVAELECALTEISKQTYGTEIWMDGDERAEILGRHLVRLRSLAFTAIKGASHDAG